MERLLTFHQLAKSYPKNNKLKFDKRPEQWLPLYPSPPLAGLVADLMADGNLQGPSKWRFDYCSNSLNELNRFEKVLFNLFLIKGKIRRCTTNKYGTMNYGVNCRPLAKTLFLIGVPYGNKVITSYLIPDWILNDKKCFTSFARRYFDCEAGVDVNNKMLSIELYKSTDLLENSLSFLNQMRQGFQHHFGIRAMNPFLLSKKVKRTYGATVQGTRLRIKRKAAVKKFYIDIGFDNFVKMKKLRLSIT